MNIPLSRSAFTSTSIFAALTLTLVFCSFATVSGQTTTTFGQFFERYGWNDFQFANCNDLDPGHVDGSVGPHSHFQNVDTVNGAAVYFLYQNVSGLNPQLMGVQNAHVFVTSVSNVAAATPDGFTDNQPFNYEFTVAIIRDTPFNVGNGPGTNLLTIKFSPNTRTPFLSGPDGGNSANIFASTPSHTVTYTSDFLDFTLVTVKKNMSLSFSSASPEIVMPAPGFGAAGTYLQDFTAAGSGTFGSNPAPVVKGPTAAAVSISGRVINLNKGGIGSGPGVGAATVTVVESNGEVHEVLTTNRGYFQVNGLNAGQNVMLSVQSKQYAFTPMMLNLSDSIADLVIVAQR